MTINKAWESGTLLYTKVKLKEKTGLELQLVQRTFILTTQEKNEGIIHMMIPMQFHDPRWDIHKLVFMITLPNLVRHAEK